MPLPQDDELDAIVADSKTMAELETRVAEMDAERQRKIVKGARVIRRIGQNSDGWNKTVGQSHEPS
jgi:hypothetical protein